MKRLVLMALAALLALGGEAQISRLRIDYEGIAEAGPLFLKALEINRRAQERERKHHRELAKKGIAEVAASKAAVKYSLDTAGIGSFLFDNWGELYIDRRFVTDEEMKVVHRIEALIARWFPRGPKTAKPTPRKIAGAVGLPVFRGFEDARYQQHDRLIARLVKDFNANKAKWCGGTPEQAAKIPDMTAALVKSHMIEESGGNGNASKAAWAVDPLQVNVPGDWGGEKSLVGLKRPAKRNEGAVEANVKAAIMYLSRKGFSSSARPAAERPRGCFDGWAKALQRYNGRRDRTDTDRYYSDEYADKIVRRAGNPDLFVPIEIKLAKNPASSAP